MEVQTVKIGNEKLIPIGAPRAGISVRRFGIAKVLWRQLNVNVPACCDGLTDLRQTGDADRSLVVLAF